MINRLKHTLMLSDQDVLQYTHEVLCTLGYTVYTDRRNYVFGVPKGTCIPVLLQAHIDTERTTLEEPVELLEVNGVITNANGCLGGDDRAGVAGILEVAAMYSSKPFILLTNFEEPSNGNMNEGMRTFINSALLVPYLDYIYMVIAMDRRGHNQFVTYKCTASDEVLRAFRSNGYVEEQGISTDGIDLQDAYNIMFVNVSAGYFYAHTSSEFILDESYIHCVKRLASVIPSISCKQVPIRPVTKYIPAAIRKNPRPDPIDITPKIITPSTIEKKELIVSRMAEVCVMCGRADRPSKYYTEIGQRLCHVCINKVLAYGKLTHKNLLTAMAILQKEQDRTKLANRLYNSNIASTLPVCPACGYSTYVKWSKPHLGFICDSCRSRLPDEYNGTFWVLNNEKLRVQKGQVLHTSMDGRKLLRVTNLFDHPNIKVCDCCKNPSLNYKAFIQEGAPLQPTYLCRTCEIEMEQVCNLYDIKG